jgi:excisionase family DNA binding protein
MEKLYTIKEVCEMMKISRATLYRIIQKHNLLPVKIGGNVRFKESELNRFLSSLNGKKD